MAKSRARAAAADPSRKFPNQLYVHRGEAATIDRDDFYADVDLPDAETGEPVAVYRLVEIKTLRVQRRLE